MNSVDAPQYINPAPPINPLGADFLPSQVAMRRAALAMLPTTPVSFNEDPLLAWGRIIGYGTLSYMAWKKSKTIGYIGLGAAGTCLVTSLSAGAWGR